MPVTYAQNYDSKYFGKEESNMTYDNIVYEKNKPFHRIATITLNRPEKLNAMNPPLLTEFAEALDDAGKDDEIRVVIIKGAGRAFSAGYDLTPAPQAGPEVRRDVEEDRQRLSQQIDLWLKIWDLPKPVIAQVHGYCLAGACQMTTFCDITILAEDARLGTPSIPVGGGLISPTMCWLIGPKLAKELSFNSGVHMSGKEMAAAGFGRAVPADKLVEEVNTLAKSITRTPLPILRIKKQAVNRVMDIQGFREAVHFGAEWDAILHYSEPVSELSGWIREKGLKEAIAQYNQGS